MKKLSFLKCFVETLPSASESLVKTLRATSLLGMMLLAPMGATAQVTIGSGDLPQATLDVVATAPGDATVPEGVIVPRLTKAQINAKQASYTAAQTGATVYVTDFSAPSVSGYSDRISCIGFAYWSGSQWMTNCDAVTTKKTITQPQPFTFYERGTETPVALTFTVTGAVTYEWRKITSSNIHVRISEPCTAADGTGFNTASFTPTGVIKGSTEIAGNTGFYRYFCVATDQTGDEVTSNLAEVAVGCGAKGMNGEWLSFMCHNLGATTTRAIAGFKSTSITLVANSAASGNFLRSANERSLYGDLYQWGRIADGHQNRNAIPVNGTGGVDATDNCRAWNTTTPPTYESYTIPGTSTRMPVNQVARGTTYYGRFIKSLSANYYNWYIGTTASADDLWRESAYNANDPCRKVTTDGTVPSGNVAGWYPTSSTSPQTSGTNWRIPSQSEWADLYRGGTTGGSPANALANTWTWYQLSSSATEGAKGYEVKPDGVTTTLFLPASGIRNNGTALLSSSGSGGYYWSGSHIDGNSFSLYFGSGSVVPAGSSYRGYGFALRCIKNY